MKDSRFLSTCFEGLPAELKQFGLTAKPHFSKLSRIAKYRKFAMRVASAAPGPFQYAARQLCRRYFTFPASKHIR